MRKKRRIPKSDIPQGSSSSRRRPDDQVGIIDKIGREIRGQYIRGRREYETARTGRQSKYAPGTHWDGGTNRSGHQRSNIWHTIAIFCVEHGLDHFSYVQQIFIDPPQHHIPQPNYLLSQKLLGQFRVESGTYSTAAQMERVRTAYAEECFKLDERLLDWADVVDHDEHREYTAHEVQRSILGDDNLALTPLFRFCLAIQQKQDDIAEYYYGAAILQYLRFHEAYRMVWGVMIPEWFHEAAICCREELLTAS